MSCWKKRDFNPRPHAGATARASRISGVSNFNPRPHAGATGNQRCGRQRHPISIHAPMRGRPGRCSGNSNLSSISIHAPMRGRHSQFWSGGRGHLISIHAPMRGRPTSGIALLDHRYFNPRPHAGATPPPGNSRPIRLFQSTPPCGGDQSGHEQQLFHHHFNPRPHAGATSPSKEKER